MTVDELTLDRLISVVDCDTCEADVWIGQRMDSPRVVLVEIRHADECPTWQAMNTAAES